MGDQVNRLNPAISSSGFRAVFSNGRIVLHRPQPGFVNAGRRLDMEDLNRNRTRQPLQSIENILEPPNSLRRSVNDANITDAVVRQRNEDAENNMQEHLENFRA